MRMREAAVKHIRELSRRQRIPIAILYLTALGLIMTANVIALLDGFALGYSIGLICEFILLIHVINRA